MPWPALILRVEKCDRVLKTMCQVMDTVLSQTKILTACWFKKTQLLGCGWEVNLDHLTLEDLHIL